MPDYDRPPGKARDEASVSGPDPQDEDDFDEEAYLTAFPDVAKAIDRGELLSGRDHYLRIGYAEKRLLRPEYLRQFGTRTGATDRAVSRIEVDALIVSASGAVFLVGWLDDRSDPLTAIMIRGSAIKQQKGMLWTRIPRLRRPDAESALPFPGQHHYGFWVFATGTSRPPIGQPPDCRIEFRFQSGARSELTRVPELSPDHELRDHVMSYLANSRYWGNPVVGAFACLDNDCGEYLVNFSRSIAQTIVNYPIVERFGHRRKRIKGSIVVPLFGIADYLFLQSCFYAHSDGIDEYEFVYVLNSPELTDRLYSEARISQTIYGLAQTLVLLPGNAGFAAANNIAIQFAKSDRLLFVNPDVFPREVGWARHHTDIIRTLPHEQTRFFGTTLYYDDGSLMHGGMYFDVDSSVEVSESRILHRKLVRVEHYGKGIPASAQYDLPRAVPAVTGAFMSLERAWFEKLGGFSEDYIFGSYEDADLCLRSWVAGVPVWLHNIPMWHLEGKGSLRRSQHDGGLLLNRWLFTRRWHSVIVPDLLGPKRRALEHVVARSVATFPSNARNRPTRLRKR